MTGTREHPARRLGGPAATLAAALILATAACGPIIPGAASDPPRLYTLTPKSTYSKDLPKVRWQLVIQAPQAAAGLNTARIARRPTPTTLDYFARAVWTDVAPKLVQTLLVESFENTGKIVAVGREGAGLRSDYVLKTDLREFQAEYFEPGLPKVRVRINAKLVKMPQRTIVASVTNEYVVTVASDTVNDIVQAFDDALGKTLKRIVQWTLRTAAGAKT